VTENDIILLDVACGSGSIAVGFAKLSKQVTGIDMSPEMIEQAKLLQQKIMLNNIVWNIDDKSDYLSSRTNSFSIVATRFSFHHLLNPFSVLNEMNRVCDIGGQIVVIDPTPSANSSIFNCLQ
jgi:ubiquinone/menaquinone biosynthesis C-methylase UbiE